MPRPSYLTDAGQAEELAALIADAADAAEAEHETRSENPSRAVLVAETQTVARYRRWADETRTAAGLPPYPPRGNRSNGAFAPRELRESVS